MQSCAVNAEYKEILTHGWSGQCLSSNQLGRAETIQEVTELGVWGEPHTREDETEGEEVTHVTRDRWRVHHCWEWSRLQSRDVVRVRSKTTLQINHNLLLSRVLTFPRSCSCSCCRLWTPCWPAESSCSSSPPPGPSLCSSESCCVTSFLLLLHAQTHMKREKRRRERKGQ